MTSEIFAYILFWVEVFIKTGFSKTPEMLPCNCKLCFNYNPLALFPFTVL